MLHQVSPVPLYTSDIYLLRDHFPANNIDVDELKLIRPAS